MKSKYLKELNVESEICPWLKKDDERYEKYKEYEKEFGVFPPANWSFDNYFARWLYCYLKDYIKDAENIVDLTYPSNIQYDGKIINFKEALDIIIKALKDYIVKNYKDAEEYSFEEEKTTVENYQKALHLFADIIRHIWW